MVNFGPVAAEIGSVVWGTPANFNGFRVMPSLLQRRRSLEDNPTLHDIWPSPVLLHYSLYRELLPPDRILPGAKFTLRQSFAFSYMPTPSVTAWHSGSGRQPNCGVVQGMESSNFRRGRNQNNLTPTCPLT